MVRPLTKHKDGVRYTRPAVVESNIDGALGANPATLRGRLLITDKTASDHLRSECLVHLVRETHRTGDSERRDGILRVLLGRCEAILTVKVSNRLPNAAQIRDDVLSAFFELLVVDGTGDRPDELDYYECKFESAFRTLRLDGIDRELRVVNRNADLPDHGDVDEPGAYEDAFARVSEAFRTPATQESTLFRQDLWEAINALPPDQRRAVILVHVLGYDEESDNPNKVTAATLCNCKGRTIRNRLSRAAKALARFKEDA
jgi:hypothetical protein